MGSRNVDKNMALYVGFDFEKRLEVDDVRGDLGRQRRERSRFKVVLVF